MATDLCENHFLGVSGRNFEIAKIRFACRKFEVDESPKLRVRVGTSNPQATVHSHLQKV